MAIFILLLVNRLHEAAFILLYRWVFHYEHAPIQAISHPRREIKDMQSCKERLIFETNVKTVTQGFVMTERTPALS